jgi:lysozyme
MPAINAAGLELLKNSESCRLEAYQDSGGVWTIGWGHTPATEGQTITQAEADQLLADDLEEVEHAVNNLCAVPLNANQFSALVDFAYNVGVEALAGSTLMRLVNAGDFEGAAKQFGRWVFADDEELPGLVTRRAAEAKLFETPT